MTEITAVNTKKLSRELSTPFEISLGTHHRFRMSQFRSN